MDKPQLTKIVIVIAIGVVLGGLILAWDKTAPPTTVDVSAGAASKTPAAKNTNNVQPEPNEGPQGGKLFTTDDFSVEVTIFEKGVPPQFRLYLYENGKPLPPAAAKVAITLSRLGAPVQLFKFTPEADYLLSDQVVEEPHSFEVAIVAEHNGKTIRWGYSQVEARVEMPDEMLKSIGVEIRTAGPAMIKPTLKLPGEIVFNPDSIVQVVPRLPGVVVAVNREPGQQVQKGEVLAVIESQVLADLRSQYRAAQRRLVLARITYEREKQLWEEKISAKQDYLAAQLVMNEAEIVSDLTSEKLRALGVQPTTDLQAKNLTRYEIRAPISGLIVARVIALGTVLKEDVTIFTVANMSTVWAEITVYPKDLAVIRLGQKATVRATALNAESEGVVSYIGALVGAQTRTAKARVIVDNKEGRWLPGMFLTVELVAEEIEVPVAVSADAIQKLHDWSVVFGRYGSYFEARPLELGRSDGRMVEVLKGLAAGEQYAAGNSFAIKADLGKAGALPDH
ncbi:MAG: efflux RND transporter periplasmic adaptor subunit [Nitrosomonadaceae bacterium]|nr:MAG: efflux RND transporter periplasmic adaptor subunit [Nitrosomonadaceae bacterium]